MNRASFETVRRRKDGSPVEISLTVSPIRNRRGEIIGASKIARDITDRRRFEAEIEAHLMNEQSLRMEAEAANRSKDPRRSLGQTRHMRSGPHAAGRLESAD